MRVALQALAAVLGGTQSLHCNGRDEALALPTEEAARIALRTQQIIAAETGVANTVDPVGGSYAIETLTDEIEAGAQAILARIERAGGTLAAIEAGLIQREIQESAYRAQLAIDAGESVVVGVNRFADEGTIRPDRHQTRRCLFSDRPGSRAPADRARPRGARRVAMRRPGSAALAAVTRRGARRHEPGAADHRRRRSASHRRRNRGRDAAGVRRVQGNCHSCDGTAAVASNA